MKTKLMQDEKIIKEGKANHSVGITNVGGTLYLTNTRVIFETNALNFMQKHHFSLLFKDISGFGKRNTLFIIPNSIFITSNEGKEDKFVVFGRDKWLKEIAERVSHI